MGAVLAAPINAITAFAGTCLGSCASGLCIRLGASGTVSTARASRCVLLWLQLFTTVLAISSEAIPREWLLWPCSKLDLAGYGSSGICACRESASIDCWPEQLIFRAEASGLFLFVSLLVMSISGCAQGASRSYTVGKFMLIVALMTISMCVGNGILTYFGAVASNVASIFLVAQSVAVMDIAYSANELMYSKVVECDRAFDRSGKTAWTVGILASSAICLCASAVWSYFLFVEYLAAVERGIVCAALGISIMLLVVSITDWCEHGSLLTSCIFVVYTMWLVCVTLTMSSGGRRSHASSWSGLAICITILVTRTGSFVDSDGAATAKAQALIDAEHALDVEGTASVADSPISSAQARAFAFECSLHAGATLFVTAFLAPSVGQFTFECYAVAVFLSLVLYGWSLVAPKVMPDRFS